MNNRVVLSMDELHPVNEPTREDQGLLVVRKQVPTLFTDRSSRHWIVLDPEGNFWTLPPVENPWNHLQPFQPDDEAVLERVPGHSGWLGLN